MPGFAPYSVPRIASSVMASLLICGPLASQEPAPPAPQPAAPAPADTKDGPAAPLTLAQAADAAVEKKLAERDALKENKTFRLGLSVGIRIITDLKDVTLREATISPIDTTLRIDGRDPTDVVLSGLVSVFPWDRKRDTVVVDGKPVIRSSCGVCWLGFVANINLASFTAGGQTTAFNKSIEGGIGAAVRLTPDFSLAATYERVFSRRLRRFVQDGGKIVVDGKPITAIDEDDGRFFVDDNLSAVSFKFVYLF